MNNDKTWKLFFIVILCGSTLFCVKGQACEPFNSPNNVDTSAVPQILALPLSSYIGKPVDSLFLQLPSNYSYRGFMPVSIGYAKGVYQAYGNYGSNISHVEIFIDNFQYLSFPNRTPTTTWSMTLAKLETISFIKVYSNNVCIYGCNNPNYY